MKPAVLVLTSTYPRWAGDTDPGFVHDLCRRLALDYEVHVLAPHFSNALREEIMEDVVVHRFRYWVEGQQQLTYDGGMLSKIQSRPWLVLLLPLFLGAQLLAACRLARRYRVALVHAHWVIPQGVVAYLLRIFYRRAALVITSHGGDVYGLQGRGFDYIKQRVYGAARVVTVVSQAMAEAVAAQVGRAQLEIAPMGVDLTDRFVVRAPIPGRQNLIFVGRLVEKKGVEVLLDGFATLLSSHPDVQLTIVGDGPLREELVQKAQELSVAHAMTFMGAVPNPDIPDLLNRHAIAVVPSVVAGSGDQEGLGLVSIEAMGCGCAVVASDLPAIRDVVTSNTNGLLFEPGNAGALADCLRRLLQDEKLRSDLASAGRKDALTRFDWSRTADRYRKIYASLV